MKTTKHLLKAFCFGSLLIILGTTCKKKDDYDAKTYYNHVVGVGYVYDGDSNKPLSNVPIEITVDVYGSSGFLLPPPPREMYYTDANGRYEVRFIKHTHYHDALFYSFFVQFYYTYPYSTSGGEIDRYFGFPVEDVKKASGIFSLDTVKFYREDYY